MLIGIYADRPTACTGMSVVCGNLAYELMMLGAKVIYFGRFGQKRGFAKETQIYDNYLYVPCEGGVWSPKTVYNSIKYYKIDVVFSEDDWFSALGLVSATRKAKVPFHFLSPIDSLPIHREAYKIFDLCNNVYIPNSAYQLVKNGIYLPHGLNSNQFYKEEPPKWKFDRYMFCWIGRDDPRKGLGRALLALKEANEKVDCGMLVRTDWRAWNAQRTLQYLNGYGKKLAVARDQMTDGNQDVLRQVYSSCGAFVCTAKAGACEMSIREANACELPTLVTDWTFMNESVVHGKSGFLIPVSDIKTDIENGCTGTMALGRHWGDISISSLAEAMVWCVENQKNAKAMGKWGKAWVIKQFNWKEIAKTLLSSIEEPLNKGKRNIKVKNNAQV